MLDLSELINDCGNLWHRQVRFQPVIVKLPLQSCS